jgi:ABC-type uncharacterized transport system involved in gliding motility auxiliary subunit
MRTRLWSGIIGIIAVLAIAVGVNVFAETRLARAQLDLTQGAIYTLAPGTRTVLAGLRQPITLRLFYSPELGTVAPAYGSYHDRVLAMLRQYVALANGRLKLELLDPEPYTDTEDRALAAGLQAVPLDQSGEQVYFGLAGNNLVDDTRNIAFFKPEREGFLEYDLTRLIYELSNPARPVVGVLSSLPLDGDPEAAMRGQQAGAQPWVAMTQLRQEYDVKLLPLDAQIIDPAIKVLLVAQAQNLSLPTQYAIDQFVMRGGRLMLMVDPDSEAESALPGPGGMPRTDLSSDLHLLLDAWGIAYDPNQVVGDLQGAWRVRTSPQDSAPAVDFVAWFNIRRGLSRSDPATADLAQVTVAAPGRLERKPKADIEFTPLLSSSPDSEMIPALSVRTAPDPAGLLAGFKADGTPKVIAARVHGVLHSAFTGPPDLPAGVARAPGLPAFKAQTDGPANLVVVADSDILADRFWVQVQDFFGQPEATAFSGNGPFLVNLIGTLAGGDALIGLRSRGQVVRPFEVVDRMERHAQAQFRQKQQALQAQLAEAQQKLDSLRQGGQGDDSVITPEQRAAIDAATRQIRETRRQQRDVQLALRQDISALETQVRVADIVAVPAVLSVVAIVLGVLRARRRARARA